MSDEALIRLAEAAGVTQEWTDAYGKPQKTSVETLRAILDALGLPCRSESDCRDSAARLNEKGGDGGLLPLITAEAHQPIALPANTAWRGKAYRIEGDENRMRDGRFSDGTHGPFELPPLAAGYHRLTIGDTETTLAVAPARCFGVADALGAAGKPAERARRLWGLAAQLYSLRRHGDGGVGDFTALEELASRAAGKGAAAIAISPVHAMFSADVSRFSPYSPSSRLFLNALHIDPARILGAKALQDALAALAPDAAQRWERCTQEELVDWPEAGGLRLEVLRLLYRRFVERSDRTEFDAFVREGGDALLDHACFEAIQASRIAAGDSGYWRHWPEALQRPGNSEVRRFAQTHRDEVDFYSFLQWQAAKGLSRAQRGARQSGMPIGLITDLAVGADNGGSQAWSRQQEIITGLSVGAPPDQLNARGQSWGLGAFSPHAMREKGFHAYIEMLRAAFAHAGGVRIDHVLGLARLWLVPDGASADQGAYLRYPMTDLLRLIALESWRHQAIVIGEDLGTVPPGFDQTLARAGLLGIRVLFFQRHANGFHRASDWSDQAIATTTTHDLPTVAGWWSGRDIAWRTRLDLHPVGESEDDVRRTRAAERAELWQTFVEQGCAQGDMPADTDAAPTEAAACFIGKTPAPLAILPIEDALGLPEQPNLPGTVDSHPNWRRRLPASVETLFETPQAEACLSRLNRARNGEAG